MKSGNIIVGVLAGFAAGAVLGILFAPDKGCNTRKKIVEKGNDLKNNVKKGLNDVLSSVEDQYHTIVSKTEEVVEEGKSTFENIKQDSNKNNNY